MQYFGIGGGDFLGFVVIQLGQQVCIGYVFWIGIEYVWYVGLDFYVIGIEQCVEIGC